MFRFLLNTATLVLDLEPRSAFLVKSGDKGGNLVHPERPDMNALRTRDKDGLETVFLPGSTLKGVVRSASERLLRSLDPAHPDGVACDPLERSSACQPVADEVFRREGRQVRFEHKAEVYRRQCYACRTFGSQSIASRVRFEDSLPTPKTRVRANRTSRRSCVAIDRQTGGPSRDKRYDLEVVTGGTYRARVQADNLQLWQLALLGAVLEDIDLGITRIGSSKTRGLGAFSVKLSSVTWRQQGEGDAPVGVGELLGEAAQVHGMVTGDRLDVVPGLAKADTGGLWTSWSWEGEAGWELFRAAQGAPWKALARHLEGTT